VSSGAGREKTSAYRLKPKFREIDLKLKKLTGLCYATDESLEDAAPLAESSGAGSSASLGSSSVPSSTGMALANLASSTPAASSP
jgi:hypothetical protein